MTELTSGVHLTTSRVNRLLRPLRNKCHSLAGLSKSAAASRLTYSKQSSNWDPDSRPPLTVLCPSVGTRKSMPDRHSADDFELSRRIYAVCDAFKNIAYVAYGQPCAQRFPSLAAMCTLVIGGDMFATDMDSTLVNSSENSTNENDLLDVDAIYDAVPPHYRRFLIVSHALSMILGVCVHHHTLVTILLDHCLSFGLVHESTHLLNIILAQAILPSNPSHPPPVTHPAHQNYLLDLHAKWTAGNRPSGTSSEPLLFTTSTFCRAVLHTLSQSPSYNSHILWTSKVLNRLLHVVERCDLDSYISFVYTFSQTFWGTPSSSPDTTQDDAAQPAALGHKLSELISNLFDLLFARSGSNSSPLTPSRINAAVDILYECYVARLHRFRMSTPGSSIDLPDIIIVFTIHISVAFQSAIDNSEHLIAILDDSSPVPTTFSKLMMYFSQLRDSQAFGDFMETFFAQLNTYSSALCSEKLFGLDASLWACALHHFDTFIASSQKGNPTLITRYKQQLMEAVDVAERRCFGNVDGSPVISLPIHSNHAKRTKRGRPSGHWEWEDMVGSWIRKTPVHKKQKVDDSRLHNLSRPLRTTTSKVASRSACTSTPLSTRHWRPSTLSPTSSHSFESDGSEYQDQTDKENHPGSSPLVVKRCRPIERRSSNFFSLLADAQTNRIVLHPKSCPTSKSPCPAIPEKYVQPFPSQEPRKVPQEQKPSHRKTLPSTMLGTLHPSDDSLDLFAYATSSPAWY